MQTINDIWVINKGQTTFDRIDMSIKKQIKLEPGIPKPLPRNIAIDYVKKYSSIRFCENPEKYFNANRKLNQLVIRDAGIGDLILLEPVLRALSEDDKREVSLLSMMPEINTYTPYIKDNVLLSEKNNLSILKDKQYDSVDDLRNYSETAPNRDKKHRTDIYNEKFNVELKDKEPRLYFDKNEKSLLTKDTKKRYIAVQLDASHTYRRYFKPYKLIDYIVKQDKNNIVVLLGGYDYIKQNSNKQIIDFQGKTTIRQAINIIKDCDYFIGVDSGLMHVALALHIPTVCIFNIITPDFRLRYYTGQRKVITGNVSCVGCGDWHMYVCKHGDAKRDINFIPPCMNLDEKHIYDEMISMTPIKEKRVFYNDKKEIKSNVNILPSKKLIMPIMVLNEEKNLPRFIELVVNHPAIGKVIAIDGGSNDRTVKLLESAGCYVYTHHYIKSYHEMQAMQRNISCSYCKNGDKIIIMDIDECFSKDLSEYLPVLAESSIHYGLISRRTFNYYKDINDPSKQIKDYPDWQPRFYTWDWKYKFVGGAHHKTLNTPEPTLIQKDIIHFEKEGKDDIGRSEMEKQWSTMMTGVRQYA